MNAIICGLKVAALVDTGSSHNFISERTTKRLHRKPECCEVLVKVVNSVVEQTMGVVFSTSLEVGDWIVTLDLIVTPMDNHNVVLGQDFLNQAQEIPMPQMNNLMFMNESRTCIMLMVTRNRLGSMARMTDIRLVEAIDEPMYKPYFTAQQQGEKGSSTMKLDTHGEEVQT